MNITPKRIKNDSSFRNKKTSQIATLNGNRNFKEDIAFQENNNENVPPMENYTENFEKPNEEEFELTECQITTVTSKKSKRPYKKKVVDSPETIRAKHEEKMRFISHFAEISLTYSQFLSNKLDKKSSGNVLNRRNGHLPSNRGTLDITKRLKYFEGGTLHDYQIEGVTWMTVLFENSVNGILADEMGLGKTIQIIALFCHLYERHVNGPYLIVAPLSTLGNWEAEFKRFAPKLPVIRLQGSEQERADQKNKIRKTFFLENREVQPVVIVSYQIPLYENKFLQQFNWTYIVVDEGHRIKNPESRLSIELRILKSENRVLLTGTPLHNNIKELWALYNFLMPELFQEIEGFSTLLELEDCKDKNKILENEARTQVISTIHKVLTPFMLRREKKLVLDNLVPKKELIIYCPLTELQNYLYRASLQRDMAKLLMKKTEDVDTTPTTSTNSRPIRYAAAATNKRLNNFYSTLTSSPKRKRSQSYDSDDSDVEVYYENILSLSIKEKLKKSEGYVYPNKDTVPVKCLQCPYICRLTMQNIAMMLKKTVNHPYLVWCPIKPDTKHLELNVTEDLIKQSGKLLVLDVLLPELRKRGHKILLFSTLVMFMNIVEEFLIMRKFEYRRLDGSMSLDIRNEAIDDFNNDPNVFIFMISTRAGGLGLNLTAADTVIFLDRDWNPMADLQAQDRCHRIGQTKPVVIYSLIVKGTIDEIILNCGDVKRRLEKVIIKEGKFRNLAKGIVEPDTIKELEELLNKEEELTKVQSNGIISSKQELNKILDRGDLLKEIEHSS